jgi:16S rRNA (adenine1518-N6/adenine1519-N6)-dimethyltransferase
MNFTDLNVPELLRKYGLKPDKRLGQNFLIDPAALERIVEAAEIQEDDIVLEIGPGLGNLTRYLAERAKRIVAVEIDEDLIRILKQLFADQSNVTIVQGDILETDPDRIIEASNYLVVANIPYYITSALIRHLLEAKVRPSQIVLTVQVEVAQRVCAEPGEMSLLALSVQVYGEPSITTRIPAGAFYPVPKVDSAVVRVDVYPEARIPEADLDLFFQLAKAGFSQKRKTLRNSLSAGMHLPPLEMEEILRSAGIESRRRAQSLSIDEWGLLVDAFRHRNST